MPRTDFHHLQELLKDKEAMAKLGPEHLVEMISDLRQDYLDKFSQDLSWKSLHEHAYAIAAKATHDANILRQKNARLYKRIERLRKQLNQTRPQGKEVW